MQTDMDYQAFGETVKAFLAGNKDWTVAAGRDEIKEVCTAKWECAGENADHRGESGETFYVFMAVSVEKLFEVYRKEGWAAVQAGLEEQMSCRNGKKKNRRHRCEDYMDLLDEEEKILFAELRSLRAGIAREERVPPYLIVVNRSLYEMCLRLPSTMEELRMVYGIGEKNSAKYGEAFLQQIRRHTAGMRAGE